MRALLSNYLTRLFAPLKLYSNKVRGPWTNKIRTSLPSVNKRIKQQYLIPLGGWPQVLQNPTSISNVQWQIIASHYGKLWKVVFFVEAWSTMLLLSSVFSGFLAKMKWWQHIFFINCFSGDTKFFHDKLYINNCSKDALKTFNLCYCTKKRVKCGWHREYSGSKLSDGTNFLAIDISKI
jgi:hypothetical protein